MRGKEVDNTAENEVGIVWAGATTNYASRFCNLSKPREIFIDEKTFSELTEKEELWIKNFRVKNNKVFCGYSSEGFYLTLPDDITQQPEFDSENITSDMNSELRAISTYEDISKRAEAVAIAENSVQKREDAVKSRETKVTSEEQQLSKLEDALDSKDKENKRNEYALHRNLFSNTHCKDKIIEELGQDFWLDLIEKMYTFGELIGKSKTEVKSDLSYYLVRIFLVFEMYEEAYDALCIQAEYSSWVNAGIVESVVRKSKHWARLKTILEKRVGTEFYNALTKLKEMGY